MRAQLVSVNRPTIFGGALEVENICVKYSVSQVADAKRMFEMKAIHVLVLNDLNTVFIKYRIHQLDHAIKIEQSTTLKRQTFFIK